MKEEIKINQNFINGWNRNKIFKKTLKDIKSITPADKNQLDELKAFFKIAVIPFMESTRESILERHLLLNDLERDFKQMEKEFDILDKAIDKKSKELSNGK